MVGFDNLPEYKVILSWLSVGFPTERVILRTNSRLLTCLSAYKLPVW